MERIRIKQIQLQNLQISVKRVTTKLVFVNQFFHRMLHILTKTIASTQGQSVESQYAYYLKIELLSILMIYKNHLIAFITYMETHYPYQVIKNIFEEILPFEAPYSSEGFDLSKLETLVDLLNSLFLSFKQGKVDLDPDVFLEPIFDDLVRRNVPELYEDLLRSMLFSKAPDLDTYCDVYLKFFLIGLRYHPDISTDIQVWSPLMPLFKLFRELLPELVDPRRVLTEEKYNRILGGLT